jgi:hypothetical protein
LHLIERLNAGLNRELTRISALAGFGTSVPHLQCAAGTGETTLLSEVAVDQATLQSLLDRLYFLGLPLIAVNEEMVATVVSATNHCHCGKF